MSDEADIDILADRVDALACVKCGRHLDLRGLKPFSEVECSGCQTMQAVPLRLGNFYLLKELGKGGMGAVYKAVDQTLGRYVAIKVMRREMGEDAEGFETFLREARAAAALNHRNVVQIYSCGQEKGQPYIVMELVPGGRLDELMSAGEPLNETRVMEIAVDIAQGLAAAHEVHLVHGDIKPANILFGRGNEAKVVDFGLARFMAEHHAPGDIWGTPFYVAPEKVRKQPEDHRSDIYSLGATLFHALSGVPPFDGETAKDVVVARLKNKAPDLRDVRESIHPETELTIARMLAEDPARRYPTYASLLPDLHKALAATRRGPAPARPKAVEKKSKRGVLVLGILLLVGAIGVGAFWAVNHFGDSDEQEVEEGEFKLVLQADGTILRVPVTPEETPEPPGDTIPDKAPETGESAKEDVAPMFAPEQTKKLQKAFAALAAGRWAEGSKSLEQLVARPATGDDAKDWLRLFRVVAVWVNGGDYQQRLANLGGRSVEKNVAATNAAVVVRDLARVASGQIPEIDTYPPAADWTDHERALALFFTGLSLVHEGRIEDAIGRFSNYNNLDGAGEDAWAYALHPLAETIERQARAWITTKEQADDMVSRGAYDEALKSVKSYRSKALPPLHEMAQNEIATLEGKLEETAAEATARQEQIASDIDVVNKARAGVARLLRIRNFRKAAKQIEKQSSALTTGEGKAWCKTVAEGYHLLQSLHEFVIDSVAKQPFGDAAKNHLHGSAIGADKTGIRISLDGRVETLKPWKEVHPRLYVWIAERYIDSMPGNDNAKAKRWYALAFYCYEGGALEQAKKYAKKASSLDGSLQERIGKLMPETVL